MHVDQVGQQVMVAVVVDVEGEGITEEHDEES